MKIDSLLESFLSERAQYTPQVVAYHATSKNNLRSILKSGLIPNHSKSGYGSEEKDIDFGFSLSALDGVYVTTRAGDVEAIAKQIPASPIIIVCKVQKRTGTLDEDRLAGLIGDDRIARNIRMALRSDGKQLSPERQNAIVQQETNEILQSLNGKASDEIIKRVQPDIFQYITVLVKILMNHYSSQEAMDADVRQLQDTMTKKLKNLLHHDSANEQFSFKINQTIGFSGANKIVGIYDFNSGVGWGDLGAFERDAYHKVKTPIELINTK